MIPKLLSKVLWFLSTIPLVNPLVWINKQYNFCIFCVSEPSPGPCAGHHQQWSPWGLHPYRSRRYREEAGRGRVTAASRQPGHLAALHWCPRGRLQEHQDHRRVPGWWAHQRSKGTAAWTVMGLLISGLDTKNRLLALARVLARISKMPVQKRDSEDFCQCRFRYSASSNP